MGITSQGESEATYSNKFIVLKNEIFSHQSDVSNSKNHFETIAESNFL
jgi:hypothetical protein